MLEALWTVEFESNIGGWGGGIVIFETGRVFGGDAQYTYIGHYKVDADGGMLRAEVEIAKFLNVPGGLSVFGQADRFKLLLAGAPGRDQMVMHGEVIGRPDLRIEVRFKRRAELPS